MKPNTHAADEASVKDPASLNEAERDLATAATELVRYARDVQRFAARIGGGLEDLRTATERCRNALQAIEANATFIQREARR